MTTLPAHVFKDSFRPFFELLNEHKVKYQMREMRSGVPMASSGVIEIVQAIGAASMWAGLAAVLVAFIKSRSSRKVIVTTKDNTTIHAEGLTASELERILAIAASIAVIDTGGSQPEQSIDNSDGA
ncbi:effector-associated constant component EACC1 [Aeromonas hydrophila]